MEYLISKAYIENCAYKIGSGVVLYPLSLEQKKKLKENKSSLKIIRMAFHTIFLVKEDTKMINYSCHCLCMPHTCVVCKLNVALDIPTVRTVSLTSHHSFSMSLEEWFRHMIYDKSRWMVVKIPILSAGDSFFMDFNKAFAADLFAYLYLYDHF